MNTMFLVRGENGGEPESYVLGLYSSETAAQARIDEMTEEGEALEYMWFEELTVGLDVFNSNR